MRILFLGDIFARAGRVAVHKHLSNLKNHFKPEIIVINGENAAAGSGITIKLADELFEMGVHCVTTGNHVWRQKELIMHIDRYPNLLRPLNFPDTAPGKGAYLYKLPDGRKILIAQLMGQINMYPTLDDPFSAANKLVEACPLGSAADAILIDMHAEATSEKVSMGHHLDGRVSAVLGTHTHIPTADDHILEKGTAFQTDVGMCGDYDSSIGTKKDIILRRFTGKLNNERFEPATGEASVCGTFVLTDDKTGLAKEIQAFQLGGSLKTRGITIE